MADSPAVGPSPRPPRRSAPPQAPDPVKPAQVRPWWLGWFNLSSIQPRTVVLAGLGAVFLLGGGRRLGRAIAARRALAALAGTDPDPRDVRAAAEQGRVALGDLLRLLDQGQRPEVRLAAGQGLARLWRLDELVGEEERNLVKQGFVASWRARRTYPRSLTTPIVVRVDLIVSFLRDAPGEVGPDHLRWSTRVLGTQSARLEAWTETPAASPHVEIPIDPADYPGRGPHRLTIQTRVRTVNLTESWTLDLPDEGFALEFDPRLDLAALLTLPDAARGAEVAHRVRLRPRSGADPTARVVPLGPDFVLADPPVLAIEPGLPCDLAHRLAIEVEGVAGVWPVGPVVVSTRAKADGPTVIALGAPSGWPEDAIDRPGPRRLRAILTADPGLGWADPEIRSVWPGSITTDWVEVRILRA